MTKLEAGTKYLSIGLDAAKMLALSMKAVNDGEAFITVAAFKIDNPEKETSANYESVGVKVWINTKKIKEEDA
jgi:hypothetical protein